MKDIYAVPEGVSAGSENSIPNMDRYRETYLNSIADPSGFWLEEAKKRLLWRKEPTVGMKGSFFTLEEGPITWFEDGLLNVSENCVDRHAKARPDKTAILWEGDEPGEGRAISYKELLREVSQLASALASLGVQKGDRVVIYMGMVPEIAIAMLACARLGAIHSVVFGGFSSESVKDRIVDCEAKWVITQDEGRRGGRPVALKAVVDEALAEGDLVEKVVVFQRTGGEVEMKPGRDLFWGEITKDAPEFFEPVALPAEHPLYILYTSGSTGKPKGVVHASGGYLAHIAYTHELVFDVREDDVYACMADVGWVTGHSYIVYAPLANGSTTVMFESTPLYPDAGRYWEMVERLKINIFYTAPTAIRTLAASGDDFVKRYDRSSLRVLGTVGEPINAAAWQWYFNVVGDKKCTIIDTYWQTETGGICVSPIAPATPTKPSAATYPLPGIQPILMDNDGHIIRGPGEGKLCYAIPWPGLSRTVWHNHERYVNTYFKTYPGYYFTGDGARRDEDGYYFLTGRVDDVINVSGHRMGTAEFESVLASLDEVAEAAVVGFPHDIKGQGVYAYVVLQDGVKASEALEKSLNQAVRNHIGVHVRVDLFQFVPNLPKTRSGKIMRRILRKIAEGRPDQLGNITTLADPSIVAVIVAGSKVKA